MPPKKCGKCRRMISRVESILKELGMSEEIQQYPTWVLPTLIINDKIVARGYLPSNDLARKALKKV